MSDGPRAFPSPGKRPPGLAAQACLFTVALGGSTSAVGRVIACCLSIGASFTSLVVRRVDADPFG